MYAHHTHYFNECYNKEKALEELDPKFRQFRREVYDICNKYDVGLEELIAIYNNILIKDYSKNNKSIELTIDILDYTNTKLQVKEGCLPKGTRILTDTGYRKIEDIYSFKQKD